MDTKKLQHKMYTLPEGYACKTFVIRELCGVDQVKAMNVAESLGANGSLQTELIRRCIVAVDGEAVSQPYFQLDSWPMTTWQFLMSAFEDLNSTPDLDLEAFKAAGSQLSDEELAAIAG